MKNLLKRLLNFFGFGSEPKGDDMKKKFDVVVGNPPYLRNLHLDLLQQSLQLLNNNGIGVLIQPASWMLNEVPGQRIQKVVHDVDMHVVKSVLFNGQEHFDLQNDAFGIPLSITFFQKEPRQNTITVEDKIRGQTYTANSITEMNKFGDNEHYRALRTTILDLVKTQGSMADHINPKNNYPWYVCLPQISGKANNKTGLPMSNFYTFFSRNRQNIFEGKPENASRAFGFMLREHAENFEACLL